MISRCRRAPFLVSYQDFSIGVCRASSWAPSPKEVRDAARFSARDVSSPRALFVADPFLARGSEEWLLFFELMPVASLRGVIGLARSTDLRSWSYDGVVLDEEFHLSFPFVFRWRDEWFMMPETSECEEVRLYRATGFPLNWEFERTLLKGKFSDSVMWEHAGTWFMLSSPRMETARLFLAESPIGPWEEHPCSPIVADDLTAGRAAGPVVKAGDAMIRLAQDCKGTYGRAVSAYAITRLSADDYAEERMGSEPLLGPESAHGRSRGMHHLHALEAGPGEWVAAFDRWVLRRRFARVGIFTGNRKIR